MADAFLPVPVYLAISPGATADRSLAILVLTIVELLRQLMERQAIRRLDQGDLTEMQIERLLRGCSGRPEPRPRAARPATRRRLICVLTDVGSSDSTAGASAWPGSRWQPRRAALIGDVDIRAPLHS